MTVALAEYTAWHDVGVESGRRAETLSELGDLLTSLSSRPVVSVRYGRFPDGATAGHRLGPLAGQVYDLVAELHLMRERCVPSGAAPPNASQIEALLEPLSADAALELMATLAADNLVWPGSKLMNREIAHQTVTRIVKWFGARHGLVDEPARQCLGSRHRLHFRWRGCGKQR